MRGSRLGTLFEDEVAAAIRAVHRTLFPHIEENARVSQSAVAAVTMDLRRIDLDGFGRFHGRVASMT